MSRSVRGLANEPDTNTWYRQTLKAAAARIIARLAQHGLERDLGDCLGMSSAETKYPRAYEPEVFAPGRKDGVRSSWED